MKRKFGAITIGQAPRDDVIPEMIEFLGQDVEIIQAGALDGLTLEEIKEFAPEEGDYVLVSLLKDGTSVSFSEKHILPRLQMCIDKLEEEKVDIILFLCTGEFPDTFKSNVPIIYPQKIIHSLVPTILNNGKLAIISPDKSQIPQTKKKWENLGSEVKVLAASPYSKLDEFEEAINILKKQDIDIIIMDCIGYTQDMKNRVKEGTGKMVILSRTIVARALGEILN